jgi:hypothetical protein
MLIWVPNQAHTQETALVEATKAEAEKKQRMAVLDRAALMQTQRNSNPTVIIKTEMNGTAV